MKKSLIISIVLLSPLVILSQELFQNISFQEAVRRSSETGKLIFLQFESANCGRCNDVANKAFEDKELIIQLNQIFICLRISPSHPDRETISMLYNIKESFGSFFIDQNKALIHVFRKSSTRAVDYKEQIDLVIYKSGEDIRISELEKEYKNGNKNIQTIQVLLLKRKSLNLETDSLLAEYITMLPSDSLNSVYTLVFIAEMAPVIDSKEDLLLRKNNILFNKAWYTIKLPSRLEINNRIINKSMQKAIKEKKESFAFRVASFVQSTYTGNTHVGKQAYENTLLKFYKETNDTANYLIRAVYFYDTYYMSVSVDSIKSKDSIVRLSMLEKQSAASGNTKISGTFRQVIQFSPSTQYFTGELNKAAWNIYKMSGEPHYIDKALQWSKRANEFYEDPEAMDTYARLLYKKDNKSEAISWEDKAVLMQKKRGFPAISFEKVLVKMKQNQDKIDE